MHNNNTTLTGAIKNNRRSRRNTRVPKFWSFFLLPQLPLLFIVVAVIGPGQQRQTKQRPSKRRKLAFAKLSPPLHWLCFHCFDPVVETVAATNGWEVR